MNFSDNLIQSIEQLVMRGGLPDRLWWNGVATGALAALAPCCVPPSHGKSRDAFLFFIKLASRNANPAIGIQDEPSWLSRHFSRIAHEAEECRPIEQNTELPTYVKAGRAALQLTCDAEFHEWASATLNVPLNSVMKITYIFYMTQGQQCRIHLDDLEYYEYNCLIGIRTRRERNSAELSHLRIILPTGEPYDVDLIDGRVAIFHASHLAHGRTPLSKGEEVVLLSIGLNTDQKVV